MFGSFGTLADTPDEAAFHLASAMGCCDEQLTQQPQRNSNRQRIVQHEILELQSQKQQLQLQLEVVTDRLCKLPTLLQLGSEVKFYNELIIQLQQENQNARTIGLQNLQAIAAEYCNIEHDKAALTCRNQQISVVYQQEAEQNRQLRTEIQTVMLRIRQLHDRNNELVRMFV